MKRLVVFVLFAVLLFTCFSGCDKGKTQNTVSSQEASNSYEDQFSVAGEMHTLYMTFEESLARASHIVRARYTGEKITEKHYIDLKFVSLDIVKGKTIEKEFYVRLLNYQAYVAEGGGSYLPTSAKYDEGKEYLLVLEAENSVYIKNACYLSMNNIVIIPGEKATIYNGSQISNHSENYKEGENIVDYVVNYVENNPDLYEHNTEYIVSDNITEIASESPYIAVVTPIEYNGGSDYNETEWYWCRVDSVLKGKIDEEKIEIVFSRNTVKKGKQYIVMMALPDKESVFYVLSSKNSLFLENSNEAEQIRDAVN